MPEKVSPQIALIGYASGLGGNRVGCKEGPRVLRERHLRERIEALHYSVSDLGNATPQVIGSELEAAREQIGESERRVHNLEPVYFACKDLATRVQQALQSENVPLVIGGDHSLSMGSVAAVADFYGAQKKSVGLLWIDTHADINTPETSASKNIHGMPVAVLLGKVSGLLASIQANTPAIDPTKLAYVGLRDLDQGEKDLIRELGIRAFTMKDIDVMGVARVMEEAIAIATQGTAGFVASFDLDVCDPAIVPGIDTPKRGGLTFREAHLVMELIYESKKLLSLELVELNPELDIDFMTADLAVALIESALGKTIL